MNAVQHRIYAAAITPIRADGTPDLERLAAHCKHLLASGCDGVAPLGTTGEAAALPFEYRLRAPEVLAKSGLANDDVLIGVGSPSIGDAISVGRSAVANGFSNLLALPPYYTKEPSDDGLYDYYARLTEAIDHDRLRVYLYHIPQVTAVAITLELIHRLRKTFGALIVGIKDSSGSFASTKSYAELDDFEVYPSSEAVLTRCDRDRLQRRDLGIDQPFRRPCEASPGRVRPGTKSSAGKTQRFSTDYPKVSSHTCGQAGPRVANRRRWMAEDVAATASVIRRSDRVTPSRDGSSGSARAAAEFLTGDMT